jgi:hypothetical protein
VLLAFAEISRAIEWSSKLKVYALSDPVMTNIADATAKEFSRQSASRPVVDRR